MATRKRMTEAEMAQLAEDVRRMKAKLPQLATKKELRDVQVKVDHRLDLLEADTSSIKKSVATLVDDNARQNDMLEQLVEGDATVMREQLAQGKFLRDMRDLFASEFDLLQKQIRLQIEKAGTPDPEKTPPTPQVKAS